MCVCVCAHVCAHIKVYTNTYIIIHTSEEIVDTSRPTQCLSSSTNSVSYLACKRKTITHTHTHTHKTHIHTHTHQTHTHTHTLTHRSQPASHHQMLINKAFRIMSMWILFQDYNHVCCQADNKREQLPSPVL